MNNIFNISQIRDIENYLFKNHIPAYDLMKKAGESAFEIICQEYPNCNKLTIFCGKGNNGGDAYIIALHALKNNFQVIIVELYDQLSPLAGKARAELKQFKNCPSLKFVKYETYKKQQKPQSKNKGFIESHTKQSLIIDAIFGIGFKGQVKDPEKSAINLINNLNREIVAIDIASGLNGDNGQIGGIAVKAHLTISFIAAKFGLLLGLGKDHSGKLHIADLDVEEGVLNKFNNHQQLLNFNKLKKFLPQRKANDHKGSHGHTLLIGGFDDMPGAIILAAKAAYRIGSGKVTIITQRKNYSIIAAALPEAMFQDINEVIGDKFNFSEFAKNFNIITIGPGLSTSAIAQKVLSKTLKLEQLKLIDADGLNLIAKYHSKQKLKNTIITPHIKEAARLLNVDSKEISDDKQKAIIEISTKYDAITILKSESCFIKDPKNQNIFISPYGNKALAKAGTGDVLSGIISGILAQSQNSNILERVQLGVSLHGKISDIFAKKHNYQSLLATDLIDELKSLVISY